MKDTAHGFMTAQPIATCPTCGKRSYTTRAQAKRAGKAMRVPNGKMRAYKCGRFWHLTSLPADTVSRHRANKAGQGNG